MIIGLTGASGHIGNCLIRELLKQGYSIKALIRELNVDFLPKETQLIQGDLLNLQSLQELCKGADIIIHTAAIISIDNRHAEEVFETNVTGTKNILQAAIKANVKKFIHFSSIDAFKAASPDQVLDEKRALVEVQKSIYEYTKAESERLVLQAAKMGYDAHILSPTAVIGPFDYRKSYLGNVLLKISAGKLPFVVKGGYNWVDVRDIAEATINSINKGKRGEKYILSGHYSSLIELSKIISDISGCRIPKALPIFLARIASPFYEIQGLLMNKTPTYTNQSLNILQKASKNISFEKAERELDYQPRPLKSTIKETLDWHFNNK